MVCAVGLAQTLGGETDVRTPGHQHPKWDTLKLTAQGTHLEVCLNCDRLIEVDDNTYDQGVIGLGALGRIQFKDLSVHGQAIRLVQPWRELPGTAPAFIYPFKSDTVDLTKPTRPRSSCPNGVVLEDGQIMLVRDLNETGESVMIRSNDHGRTWSDELVIDRKISWPFQHKDGRLSALTSVILDRDGHVLGRMTTELIKQMDAGKFEGRLETMLTYSHDGGRTWGEPQPFISGGKPLSAYGNFFGYLGLHRLSDDSILYCPYYGKTEHTIAEERTNQTFVLSSEDDGNTWSVPRPVEETHLDTNEGTVAELSNGDLLMFMRSVRSPFLWRARSTDKGRTWLPIEKTQLTLDCPLMLHHSSGLIVLQTRGGALQISADDGVTWGPVWNVGHCVHMGCMLEAADGALLFAHLDAGFADLTKVRAFRLGVTAEGPVPCD